MAGNTPQQQQQQQQFLCQPQPQLHPQQRLQQRLQLQQPLYPQDTPQQQLRQEPLKPQLQLEQQQRQLQPQPKQQQGLPQTQGQELQPQQLQPRLRPQQMQLQTGLLFQQPQLQPVLQSLGSVHPYQQQHQQVLQQQQQQQQPLEQVVPQQLQQQLGPQQLQLQTKLSLQQPQLQPELQELGSLKRQQQQQQQLLQQQQQQQPVQQVVPQRQHQQLLCHESLERPLECPLGLQQHHAPQSLRLLGESRLGVLPQPRFLLPQQRHTNRSEQRQLSQQQQHCQPQLQRKQEQQRQQQEHSTLRCAELQPLLQGERWQSQLPQCRSTPLQQVLPQQAFPLREAPAGQLQRDPVLQLQHPQRQQRQNGLLDHQRMELHEQPHQLPGQAERYDYMNQQHLLLQRQQQQLQVQPSLHDRQFRQRSLQQHQQQQHQQQQELGPRRQQPYVAAAQLQEVLWQCTPDQREQKQKEQQRQQQEHLGGFTSTSMVHALPQQSPSLQGQQRTPLPREQQHQQPQGLPQQPQQPQHTQAQDHNQGGSGGRGSAAAVGASGDSSDKLLLGAFVPITQLIKALGETRGIRRVLQWQRDCLLVSQSPAATHSETRTAATAMPAVAADEVTAAACNAASGASPKERARGVTDPETAATSENESELASAAAGAAAVAEGMSLRWVESAAVAAAATSNSGPPRVLNGSLSILYSAPTGAGKGLVAELLLLRHIFGLLDMPPLDTLQQQQLAEQQLQLQWPTSAVTAATGGTNGLTQHTSTQAPLSTVAAETASTENVAGCCKHPPRRAVVVLPFVSLIEEQQRKLQRLFAAADLPVKVVALHHCSRDTASVEAAATDPAAFDVAFCTIEKAAALLQQLAEKNLLLHRLGLLVVDELHALGDPTRGALLECLLSHVVYCNTKLLLMQQEQQRQHERQPLQPIQVVGMSATLSNISEVAAWLSAAVYCNDHRPLPLQEAYCCCSGAPAATVKRKGGQGTKGATATNTHLEVRLFTKPVAAAAANPQQPWPEVPLPPSMAPLLQKLHQQQQQHQEETAGRKFVRPSIATAMAREPLLRLLLLMLQQGNSVLIFCRSKAAVETVAVLAADYAIPLLRRCFEQQQQQHQEQEKFHFLSSAAADARMRRLRSVAVLQGGSVKDVVVSAVSAGVSIHHAGLTSEERRLAESLFREGIVKVLAATSTLAAGVNFPCDSVLFDSPHIGSNFLDSVHFRQMAGRAGRMQDKTQHQQHQQQQQQTQQQQGGRAIVVCKASEEKEVKHLLLRGTPQVESALLADSSGLQRLILGALSCSRGVLRCSGSNKDLALLVCCTFLVTQQRSRVQQQVQERQQEKQHQKQQRHSERELALLVQRETAEAVSSLVRLGLVRFAAGHYEATATGRAIAAAAMSPAEGAAACYRVAAASSRLALHDDIPLALLVAPTMPLPPAAAAAAAGGREAEAAVAAAAALTADDLRHLERAMLRMRPSELLALDQMGVGLLQLRDFMRRPSHKPIAAAAARCACKEHEEQQQQDQQQRPAAPEGEYAAAGTPAPSPAKRYCIPRGHGTHAFGCCSAGGSRQVPTVGPLDFVRLRAALALVSLLRGVPLQQVAKSFGWREGQLQQMHHQALLNTSLVASLCDRMGHWIVALLLLQLRQRLLLHEAPEQQQLQELLEVDGISLPVARLLQQHLNVHTPKQLAAVTPQKLLRLLAAHFRHSPLQQIVLHANRAASDLTRKILRGLKRYCRKRARKPQRALQQLEQQQQQQKKQLTREPTTRQSEGQEQQQHCLEQEATEQQHFICQQQRSLQEQHLEVQFLEQQHLIEQQQHTLQGQHLEQHYFQLVQQRFMHQQYLTQQRRQQIQGQHAQQQRQQQIQEQHAQQQREQQKQEQPAEQQRQKHGEFRPVQQQMRLQVQRLPQEENMGEPKETQQYLAERQQHSKKVEQQQNKVQLRLHHEPRTLQQQLLLLKKHDQQGTQTSDKLICSPSNDQLEHHEQPNAQQLPQLQQQQTISDGEPKQGRQRLPDWIANLQRHKRCLEESRVEQKPKRQEQTAQLSQTLDAERQMHPNSVQSQQQQQQQQQQPLRRLPWPSLSALCCCSNSHLTAHRPSATANPLQDGAPLRAAAAASEVGGIAGTKATDKRTGKVKVNRVGDNTRFSIDDALLLPKVCSSSGSSSNSDNSSNNQLAAALERSSFFAACMLWSEPPADAATAAASAAERDSSGRGDFSDSSSSSDSSDIGSSSSGSDEEFPEGPDGSRIRHKQTLEGVPGPAATTKEAKILPGKHLGASRATPTAGPEATVPVALLLVSPFDGCFVVPSLMPVVSSSGCSSNAALRFPALINQWLADRRHCLAVADASEWSLLLPYLGCTASFSKLMDPKLPHAMLQQRRTRAAALAGMASSHAGERLQECIKSATEVTPAAATSGATKVDAAPNLFDEAAAPVSIEAWCSLYGVTFTTHSSDSKDSSRGISSQEWLMSLAAAACWECVCLLGLLAVMGEKLADAGLFEVYLHLEYPLSLPLLRMQQQGLPLLLKPLHQLLERGARCLRSLQEATTQLVGRPFVISDSEALRAVLLQTPEVLQLLLEGDSDSAGSSSNRNTGDEALLESAQVLLLPQDVPSLLRRLRFRHPLTWILCCYTTLQPMQQTIAAIAAAAAQTPPAVLTAAPPATAVGDAAAINAAAATVAYCCLHHPLCTGVCGSGEQQKQQQRQQLRAAPGRLLPRLRMCHAEAAAGGWRVSLQLPGALQAAAVGAETQQTLKSLQQQTLHEELMILTLRLQDRQLKTAEYRFRHPTDAVLLVLLQRGQQTQRHQRQGQLQEQLPPGLRSESFDVYIHPAALKESNTRRGGSSASRHCSNSASCPRGQLLWTRREIQLQAGLQQQAQQKQQGQQKQELQQICPQRQQDQEQQKRQVEAQEKAFSWVAAVRLYPTPKSHASAAEAATATEKAREKPENIDSERDHEVLLLPASLLFRLEAPLRLYAWRYGAQQHQQQQKQCQQKQQMQQLQELQHQQSQLASLPPVGIFDVRNVVGVTEGFHLVAAELQHLELIVLAHLSGYMPLLQLLRRNSSKPTLAATEALAAAAAAKSDALAELNAALLKLLRQPPPSSANENTEQSKQSEQKQKQEQEQQGQQQQRGLSPQEVLAHALNLWTSRCESHGRAVTVFGVSFATGDKRWQRWVGLR
ncbi:DNA polymerase, putative [Eimeria tenella]|uniref:DNA polymerase, putative n=1 Tax=Eimeria tenella TaxID=5802 RepID=U6KPK6_EIMTE|nr:DNA polymerase, putative [Eimeria tenella]CDJ40042.1 DNA polymerase, putative [Eimeria tenella]|eukprot:XP_013230795.1 DNA polymerase, putative [Eimeria tenella]